MVEGIESIQEITPVIDEAFNLLPIGRNTQSGHQLPAIAVTVSWHDCRYRPAITLEGDLYSSTQNYIAHSFQDCKAVCGYPTTTMHGQPAGNVAPGCASHSLEGLCPWRLRTPPRLGELCSPRTPRTAYL